MKHLLIILALTLMLSSCKAPSYTLGMAQSEFLKQNHNANLVSLSSDMTVYKIEKIVMTSRPGIKFYYFKDGKLFQIDEGEQRPDVLIEHKN